MKQETIMTREEFSLLESSYKKLIPFYFHIKGLVATAEKQDPEQRFSISAISEIRSAFDHIMRSHGVMYEIIKKDELEGKTGKKPFEYCRINFDKAYAHLCRAGYDAFDCISIGMAFEIDRLLKDVSRVALYAVIPDANVLIVKPREKAMELVVKAKSKKDVVSREYEEKQYSEYEQVNKILKDILDILNANMAEIAKYTDDMYRLKDKTVKTLESESAGSEKEINI